MTATVYNGELSGDGSTHTQTFYTNSTGGNVRIIWNYIYFGNSYPAGFNMYIGTSTSVANATTLELSSFGQGGFYSGKHMGIYAASNYSYSGAGGSPGHMPLELVLANGHKMSLQIPAQIDNNAFAMRYNFLAVPETN
tara:strand:- start:56 stop:469 length:414 start_codon:yes stop_codon:yes gene_type:complete